MMDLKELKEKETIIALNYWENWSWLKTMSQGLGGSHPMVKKLDAEVNEIRKEWNELSELIKSLELKESTIKEDSK